jgi:hypothetical protein
VRLARPPPRTSELGKLEQYINRATIRGALKHYLFGLPIGAAVLTPPVVSMLALGDLDSGVRLVHGPISSRARSTRLTQYPGDEGSCIRA